MNAEQEIRIYGLGKLSPFLQGHILVFRAGHVNFHTFIQKEFLIHGQSSHQSHGFLFMAVLGGSQILPSMARVYDHHHFFSGILQPQSRGSLHRAPQQRCQSHSQPGT